MIRDCWSLRWLANTHTCLQCVQQWESRDYFTRDPRDPVRNSATLPRIYYYNHPGVSGAEQQHASVSRGKWWRLIGPETSPATCGSIIIYQRRHNITLYNFYPATCGGTIIYLQYRYISSISLNHNFLTSAVKQSTACTGAKFEIKSTPTWCIWCLGIWSPCTRMNVPCGGHKRFGQFREVWGPHTAECGGTPPI